LGELAIGPAHAAEDAGRLAVAIEDGLDVLPTGVMV
jgi:hypothetical protein